jgi:hypothetical protein
MNGFILIKDSSRQSYTCHFPFICKVKKLSMFPLLEIRKSSNIHTDITTSTIYKHETHPAEVGIAICSGASLIRTPLIQILHHPEGISGEQTI